MLVDVYNKKANIRELQRETELRTPHTVIDYTQVADFSNKKEYCPWIPGNSFLTDGIQFHLPILTIRPRETKGLSKLFKKGYTGFKTNTDENEPPINVNSLNKGVYCLGKDNLLLEGKDKDDYMFLGVDPGRKSPCQYLLYMEIQFQWNGQMIKEHKQ